MLLWRPFHAFGVFCRVGSVLSSRIYQFEPRAVRRRSGFNAKGRIHSFREHGKPSTGDYQKFISLVDLFCDFVELSEREFPIVVGCHEQLQILSD